METFALERIRRALTAALATALSAPEAEIAPLIKDAEPPHGDLSFATFPFAKRERIAPPALAARLAGQLSVPGLEMQAAGPYLNARFADERIAAEVIAEARGAGAAYGTREAPRGTVVIDYSSPNIAKPIAFHHIRSTVIGHALANLHRSQGFRVEGFNFLGDWGKQFGLVAVGFETYGDPARAGEMGHLVEVYVKANARAAEDPEFDERARAFFRRMEAGEAEPLALWQRLRDVSLAEFRRLYARLGIEFEHYEGESSYRDRTDAALEAIALEPGVRVSEGATIADLPYAEGEPPILLRKRDGTTLYVTRDVAAALDRFQRFAFQRALYVVATDQALHFRQLFRVLAAMELPWADRCVHVNFGRVHGMSTRKGQVVLLEDVLDEARDLALARVQENVAAGRIHTDAPGDLAEAIGIGAVVFGDLKNRRTSDYTFDWDEVLAFEGHTGPYLQYAHARCCSVIERGGGVPASFDPARLGLPEEHAVVRLVGRFPTVVADATAECEPAFVARHLLELAAGFSRWYTAGNQEREKRVLVDDDPGLRAARLALTDAVRVTLRAGLGLLGVPAPERM
jgi:arginyl-tRNA synthetase